MNQILKDEIVNCISAYANILKLSHVDNADSLIAKFLNRIYFTLEEDMKPIFAEEMTRIQVVIQKSL